MQDGFLRIENFEKMQHKDIFKKSDGKPPWIKFFVKLLDNEDFEELPYLSQLVYLKLLLLAARKENAIPNRSDWVARRIGMQPEEVAEATLNLLESGFLSHSKTRRKLRVIREPLVTEAHDESPPEENREEEKRENPRYSLDEAGIISAWRKASSLTRHRDEYLFSDKTLRAMKGALKLYPGEDIIAAIGLYDAVLASEAHYFTHRWSLIDFLKRGLDKFAPEMEPLSNFRREARSVNAGMSPAEIATMFDEEVAYAPAGVRALGRGD